MTTQIEAIDVTAQRAQSYLHQIGLRGKALATVSADKKSIVVIASESLRDKLMPAVPPTFNNFPVTRILLPRLVPA